MRHVNRILKRLIREEDGPTATEYAVMLALIIVVSITAIGLMGTNLSASFQNSRVELFGN